ncbi:MAG: alpha/beta hydrolase [Chloroflexi bacterium]|nr:alpha/beta hydrolase [Chloroflexota bacterium]
MAEHWPGGADRRWGDLPDSRHRAGPSSVPSPGQLYTVDGHQMHIVCQGEGSPTVLLEAGGGHFSATWGWVQQQVAQGTQVCAYDRAGYGWSEPGPDPRDAVRIAGELHDLLAQAAVDPPYVVVAHSVGGIYTRVFNAHYPGEVVGMVLVDTTHPDNWAQQGESIGALQAMASVASVISRFGAIRLMIASQAFDLPEAANGALKADMASAEYWQTQQQDAAAMQMSMDEARAAGDLGDLPLAVVMAVDYPEGRGRDTEYALQRELASLSRNGSFQIIEGARHITLLTNETLAAQVSGAIGRVIESARTGRPLTE